VIGDTDHRRHLNYSDITSLQIGGRGRRGHHDNMGER
jgi:hypothetical protein